MALGGYFPLLHDEYFALAQWHLPSAARAADGSPGRVPDGERLGPDAPQRVVERDQRSDEPFVFLAARFSLMVFCGFFFWSLPPVPAPRSFDFATISPPPSSSVPQVPERVRNEGTAHPRRGKPATAPPPDGTPGCAPSRCSGRGRPRRRDGASEPPDAPVSATTRMPSPRARSAARSTLAEVPLVEIAIRTSPCASERFHLSLEHPLDAEVVRDGCEERRIGGQRDGGDRRARVVDRQRADELRRQVLRVRGAATVPADQELPAGCAEMRPAGRRPSRCHPGIPPPPGEPCPPSCGGRRVPARRSPPGPWSRRTGGRGPDLVAPERPRRLGRGARTERTARPAARAPRAPPAAPTVGSTAAGTRRRRRRRSCRRWPRRPAPRTASPRSACARRCAGSSAASPRTRRGACAPSSSTSPSSMASRIA